MRRENGLTLTALIAASEPARDGGGLRATLPLAGDTLIEYQARQVAGAGASHLIILAERIPAALAGAIDRMRRFGLAVDIARTGADAADRVHPDAQVLVIADGVVADRAVIDRILAASGAAVIVVPADDDHIEFERIDGAHRWGGVMLTSGDEVAQTVAMLGDWDLVSTLLRRTVQSDPQRIDCDEAGGEVSVVSGISSMEGVRDRMLAASRLRTGGWPARHLYPPIENLAAATLLKSRISAWSVRTLALALLLGATLAFAIGFFGTGLGLTVASGIGDAIGRRLARMRLRPAPRRDWFDAARWLLSAVLGFALAFALVRQGGGWGCWALAAGLAAAMIALSLEIRLLRVMRGGAAVPPQWIADRDGLALVAIPFAIAGWWAAALAAATIYAMVSLIGTQWLHLAVAKRLASD